MNTAEGVAALAVLAVLLMMAVEAAYSARNERVLRSRGAIEPSGDVIGTMRWADPGSFVVMAIEGALTGPAPTNILAIGVAIFVVSKALKIWAIATLRERWTFRVLVLPNAPLVGHGPYAFIRHPNYFGVVGELVGVALTVWAPISGLLAVMGFGMLLLRRIAVEDRALGTK